MKKIDLRKVYVCEIAKQTGSLKNGEVVLVWGKPIVDYDYTYVYDKKSQYGLFKKTLSGYKHILTGTNYLVASNNAVGEYVVIPESVEQLVQKERALCIHLINKYKSYNMDMDVIKCLEERVNEDAQADNEQETATESNIEK